MGLIPKAASQESSPYEGGAIVDPWGAEGREEDQWLPHRST